YLRKKSDEGFVFRRFTKNSDEAWSEMQKRMKDYLATLEGVDLKSEPGLTPVERALLDAQPPSSRAPGSFRLLHREKEDTYLLLLWFFSSGSTSSLCKDYAKIQVATYFRLQTIFLAFGPGLANKVFESRPKHLKAPFGAMPWWRAPDSMLLFLLKSLRIAAAGGQPELPSSTTSIADVRESADEEDVLTLYKAASFMLDRGCVLHDDLVRLMKHRMGDGQEFVWFPNPTKFEDGEEAQDIEWYARAAYNVISQSDDWKHLLFTILGLDRGKRVDQDSLFNPRAYLVTPPPLLGSQPASDAMQGSQGNAASLPQRPLEISQEGNEDEPNTEARGSQPNKDPELSQAKGTSDGPEADAMGNREKSPTPPSLQANASLQLPTNTVFVQIEGRKRKASGAAGASPPSSPHGPQTRAQAKRKRTEEPGDDADDQEVPNPGDQHQALSLGDTPLPEGISMPEEDGWFTQSSTVRSEALNAFIAQFPGPANAHVGALVFQALRQAEAVYNEHGLSKKAWDNTLKLAEQSTNKMIKEIATWPASRLGKAQLEEEEGEEENAADEE
ncbi:hypothetical protein BV20DRAFT_983910, partial [Pilatotrama ljubarskyi]